MKLKKLPIGIQTFSKIREDNYIYIDKTDIALDMINNYQYVFLSRPRRFGKSLFLDTLQNIFEGKKEYFNGLAIEDKWDWDVKYPVITLIMNGEFLILNDLKEEIKNQLLENARKYKIELEDSKPCFMFSDLLRKLHQKFSKRVVVLIDDADKPFREKLFDDKFKKIHDFLLGFYITTKACDAYIKFAFMTGVHPIKGDMLFGFNNFTDISLHSKFGDVCGFTQSELDENILKNSKFKIDNLKLKEWYNGYNFLKSSMYNPFDILKFIQFNYTYSNYWFESGTPTFLMKLIKKQNYFLPSLANLRVDERLLNSFDIENLDLEVILYQSGYLTIDKVETTIFETQEYLLKIPNKEVKQSFSDYIINYIIKDNHLMQKKTNVYKSLLENNMDNFKSSLVSIFASIPYNNYTKNDISNYEGFYASVIYVYLQSLGLHIIGEDVTNKGRIDLTIIMESAIFIIEFKVDGSKDALEQIKEKNYHEKYKDLNKEIYLVGIEFDSKEKNISGFEWEKI